MKEPDLTYEEKLAIDRANEGIRAVRAVLMKYPDPLAVLMVVKKAMLVFNECPAPPELDAHAESLMKHIGKDAPRRTHVTVDLGTGRRRKN